MYNLTDEILQRDSIAETEKLFGNKHWSEFNETENMIMLIKAMEDNKAKSEHLQSIGDTHWGYVLAGF